MIKTLMKSFGILEAFSSKTIKLTAVQKQMIIYLTLEEPAEIHSPNHHMLFPFL